MSFLKIGGMGTGKGMSFLKIGGIGKGMGMSFGKLGGMRTGMGMKIRLCKGNGKVMGMRISRFFATLGKEADSNLCNYTERYFCSNFYEIFSL